MCWGAPSGLHAGGCHNPGRWPGLVCHWPVGPYEGVGYASSRSRYDPCPILLHLARPSGSLRLATCASLRFHRSRCPQAVGLKATSRWSRSAQPPDWIPRFLRRPNGPVTSKPRATPWVTADGSVKPCRGGPSHEGRSNSQDAVSQKGSWHRALMRIPVTTPSFTPRNAIQANGLG